MRPAVILLSGGLDSATVLAMARDAGYACHTLSLDYGQRHRSELDAARKLSAQLGAVSHSVVTLDLARFGGSALTDTAIDVPTTSSASPKGHIPMTYVPARNTIMLSLALAKAETLGSNDLFFGANAVDYSGYPDCRPEYVRAYESMANLATKAAVEGARLTIHAPIIHLSKADIIRHGSRLGVNYADTVSCYQADDAGRACGACDACRIRRDGFAGAGLPDPTRYRT